MKTGIPLLRFETLATRFREMAFLNWGLCIEIADLRTDQVDDASSQISNAFHYENGQIGRAHV